MAEGAQDVHGQPITSNQVKDVSRHRKYFLGERGGGGSVDVHGKPITSNQVKDVSRRRNYL